LKGSDGGDVDELTADRYAGTVGEDGGGLSGGGKSNLWNQINQIGEQNES